MIESRDQKDSIRKLMCMCVYERTIVLKCVNWIIDGTVGMQEKRTQNRERNRIVTHHNL